MTRFKIPKIPYWLLKKLTMSGYDEGFSGDIEEEFELRVCSKGKRDAYRWIWVHGLLAIPKSLKTKIFWSCMMLGNTIRIVFRHVKKYKLYSFLNLSGLVIAFSCSILIFLYVRYEMSYDKYHENADHVYRVIHRASDKWRGTDLWNASSGLLKPTVLEHIPEVEKATLVYHRPGTVVHDENRFRESKFFLVDPDFLEIFTFPLVKGDVETALTEPKSILLTESMAKKYFGEMDPISKTFRVGEVEYHVTGVLKDIPPNSHFTFDFLASFQTLYTTSLMRNDQIARWYNYHYTTYIKIRGEVDATELAQKISKVVQSIRKDEEADQYLLQPLRSIHLHSKVNREFEANGDIRNVTIFSAIGIFLLLIASFNYMNLSTAQAFFRAREVGVRKVTGASRGQIAFQFQAETLLYAMAALGISVLIVGNMLPVFSKFIGKTLHLNLFSNSDILMFLFVALGIGFLAGSYPSVILSRFQPVKALKDTKLLGGGTTGFRNMLIVIQYVISIAMIMSTIILYKQLHFLQTKELGYDKENVINMRIHDTGTKKQYESFKSELLKHHGISDVTYSSSLLTYNMMGGGAEWEGKEETDYINFYRLSVDENFFQFFNIQQVEGRLFHKEMITDKKRAYVLNRAAVRAIGWEQPIGKGFKQWEEGEVVGVVDDFHFQSLRLNIEPLVISMGDEFDIRYISVKAHTDGLRGSLAFIEDTFKTFSHGYPFEFSFLDERLNDLYRTDRRLGVIFTIFTCIAVFIAGMGLFGLGSFSVVKRTKEIGIRKVLGATVSRIVLMLSREFIRWVIMAAVVAFPLGYLAMHQWLQNFAYKIPIRIDVFFLTFSAAICIAFLSIGYRSTKAALSNPVDSLRSE